MDPWFSSCHTSSCKNFFENISTWQLASTLFSMEYWWQGLQTKYYVVGINLDITCPLNYAFKSWHCSVNHLPGVEASWFNFGVWPSINKAELARRKSRFYLGFRWVTFYLLLKRWPTLVYIVSFSAFHFFTSHRWIE